MKEKDKKKELFKLIKKLESNSFPKNLINNFFPMFDPEIADSITANGNDIIDKLNNLDNEENNN